MKNITIINRKTGDRKTYDAKNVKSYCKPEDIEKMRKDERHKLFSFIVEFKGLGYELGMYSVDEFDLIVE